MKNIYSLALLCMVCINASPQRLIDLKTGRLAELKESTVPCRDIVEDEDGYTVTYTFTDAILQDDSLFPGTVFWKMDGFGLNDIPGEASYLLRNDLFVIPNDCTPQVELVECTYTDFSYELTPARQPLLGNDKTGYTKETVLPIKPYEGMLPRSVATLTGTPQYRGQKLCTATVCPVQYDYAKKTVRAYTSISYKVRFVRDTAMFPEGSVVPVPKISPTDNFLRNVAIGGERFGACYSLPLDTTTLSPPIGTEIPALVDTRDYLILSCPKYREAVERFADWKRLMGFNVHTVLRNDWTPAIIKSTVREKYDECWRLYHLLIVGDHEDVPGESMPRVWYKEHKTDYYYGCIGNDDIPSIHRGRLSVSDTIEANAVVDKIIGYERDVPCDSTQYMVGYNCAQFIDKNKDGVEDTRVVKTSEEIRDYLMTKGKVIQRMYQAYNNVNPQRWNSEMYANGGAMPSELLRSNGFSWNTRTADIANSIENGCFYIAYSGHSTVDGWLYPYFSSTQVGLLNNAQRLPVVFSLGCETGKYDEDCFAEKFLRKSNGGCVAIYAASESSVFGFAEVLQAGMFDAIWPVPGLRISLKTDYDRPVSPTPSPTFELGQILDQGLTVMSEKCSQLDSIAFPPGYSNTKYTQEIFHCFGDPSMLFRTSSPKPFTNVTVNRLDSAVVVNVADNVIARITIYNRETDAVISYYGNHVNHVTTYPEDVVVSVTAHNKVPYINYGDAFYIQDETIRANISYSHAKIAVGNSVTRTKPQGSVIILNSIVTLNGRRVILDKGTFVEYGAALKVNLNP